MIYFNVPLFTGKEFHYMQEAVNNHKICGDGFFTQKCDEWIEEKFNARKALLTSSGSAALDMAALLCGLKPGDEVILPSFTFSSTANSFVLAGASLVFVDIRPDTMNIDETKIEAAITEKTKVICLVHYAGIACEMDSIMNIASKYNLLVVEDAAQAFMSKYKDKACGTIGDFGCFSFHETKNYTMGEGGAILINNSSYIERAEILREKGTNRPQFFRGEVEAYNWVDYGDSFLQSDLNAAYLWAQLEIADVINNNRLETWNTYYNAFKPLSEQGILELPKVPHECTHNAHIFYIKCKDLKTRQDFIRYMKCNDIMCVFHYIPLHSSPAGLKFGRFVGVDEHTTPDSDRLVRLPIYYNIAKEDVTKVINKTLAYFSE